MYIYLIKNDTDDLYKIGFSNDVYKRLKQLETGNPYKLVLIDKFKTNHKRKIETTLHNTLKHLNVNGEWFRLSEEFVKNFNSICQKHEDTFTYLKEMGNPFV